MEPQPPVNNPDQPQSPGVPMAPPMAQPPAPAGTVPPAPQPADPAGPQPAPGYGQPLPSPAQPAPVKKGLPTWAKILIPAALGLFVLIGGGIALLFALVGNATKDAEIVSNQVVNAIQAEDAGTIYDLASGDFKRATSEAQLEEIVSSISPALQGEESISGRTIKNDNGREMASIVYTIATGSGTVYVRVVLEKDGGEWRVINFRSSETPLKTEVK
ncbi:hypothetical protein JNJ66_04375 [Candidatus Saccharibacteria bacterium]|nr:hypothetical protein [Candidatus Saccharibacteria bacterium]